MKKKFAISLLLIMFFAAHVAVAQDQPQPAPENPFKALLERAKQMQKNQPKSSSGAVNPFTGASAAAPAMPVNTAFDMAKLKSTTNQMETRVSDLLLLENQINVMQTASMPAGVQNCEKRLIMQRLKDNTEKIVLLYQYELFLLKMITNGDIGVNHVFSITQKFEDTQLNIDEIYLADIQATTAENSDPAIIAAVANLDRLVGQLRENIDAVLDTLDPVSG